ncbi:MAG: hypothetical protein QW175_02335 [Candidatus Bathyarchaeia archaeon]
MAENYYAWLFNEAFLSICRRNTAPKLVYLALGLNPDRSQGYQGYPEVSAVWGKGERLEQGGGAEGLRAPQPEGSGFL